MSLGRILNSLRNFPHPGELMGFGNLSGKPDGILGSTLEYHTIMPGKLAQAPVVCVVHNGVFVF